MNLALALTRFALTALALLPLGVLYVLGDGCYLLLYHVVRYRRKLVRRNLTRAYPDKSLKEIRHIERQTYRHFCDYVVETIKVLHISDEEMRRRMTFRNMELVEELAKDGRPLMFYLGHYGNWEWVTSFTLWCSAGLDMCQVYHPLSGKVMDALMLQLRSRFHSESIPQDETFRALLRKKNEGRQTIIGLIADQRPPKKHHNVWMSFMRQPTALITGAERIGERLDAHYVYGDVEVVRRGYYTLTMKEIVPDMTEDHPITRQYMRMLEQTIDRAPQYYLWTHNRWKWQLDAEGQLYKSCK